jgi:hypothetical protein
MFASVGRHGMARYKHYDYRQKVMLAVSLE